MNTHSLQLHRAVRYFSFMTASSAVWMIAMPAFAELSPALDRVSVSVGALRADPIINTTLNTTYGSLGTGDVGLGQETMPRVKANIMLFDNQGLSIDFYRYKHNYNGTIANNTNVNGNAWTILGDANLDLKFDYAKLAYKWWIGSGDTVLGLGAGAAYYKLALNANAMALVNNSTAATKGEYSDSAVAPLLEVGLRHAVGSELRLFADMSGMKKSGGRMSGDIYNAAIGVEWFPTKNVGVVVDYGRSQINLNRLDTADVNFKFKVQGPSTFVKVRF